MRGGIDRREVAKSLEKPAPYGPDLDLSRYNMEPPSVQELRESEVDKGIAEGADRVGLKIESIAYIQANERMIYTAMSRALAKYGVVVLPLREALEKYELAGELSWKLADPAADKYTAAAYLYGGDAGYFVYVPPGVKVPMPIYTCLAITAEKVIQFAHNIIYLDDGAEASVLTGCTIPHGISDGLHIGISEFYVGRGARLVYAMLHAWARGLHVRPRTAVHVKEGGEYVSYYITYTPISTLQTMPAIKLETNARAYSASVIMGMENGVYDIGTRALLLGKGASSELISRVVALDSSRIFARGEIEAWEPETRGHVECLGLLLSDNAYISSIPVISSRRQGSNLSHEAAIGMIAERELDYLMSKGFTEEEARAVLIRGFMNVDAPLPRNIRENVDRILDIVAKYATG